MPDWAIINSSSSSGGVSVSTAAAEAAAIDALNRMAHVLAASLPRRCCTQVFPPSVYRHIFRQSPTLTQNYCCFLSHGGQTDSFGSSLKSVSALKDFKIRIVATVLIRYIAYNLEP